MEGKSKPKGCNAKKCNFLFDFFYLNHLEHFVKINDFKFYVF
jgi:Na+-transporting NADH:ubiquinone oxidoreductase subunit NqrF